MEAEGDSAARTEKSPDVEEKEAAASQETASSGWYFFGWGTPGDAAASAGDAAAGGDASTKEEEQEGAGANAEREAGATRTVRFEEAAADKSGGGGGRARKASSVLNLGFVDLVETLLLNHDASGPRGLRKALSSSSSINTDMVSETDSFASYDSRFEGASDDADGPLRSRFFADGECPLWLAEAEELNALLREVHERIRVQLDEEALFLDSRIREGIRKVRQDLTTEETESLKGLLLEARRFAEGRTLLDSSEEEELSEEEEQKRSDGEDKGAAVEKPRRLRKVDLVSLMRITARTLENWKKNQRDAKEAIATSTHRSARGRLTERRLGNAVSGGAKLRSPLFQMHQQLEGMASTSSSSSCTSQESEGEGADTPRTSPLKPSSSSGVASSNGAESGRPLPPRVPPLPLGLAATGGESQVHTSTERPSSPNSFFTERDSPPEAKASPTAPEKSAQRVSEDEKTVLPPLQAEAS